MVGYVSENLRQKDLEELFILGGSVKICFKIYDDVKTSNGNGH